MGRPGMVVIPMTMAGKVTGFSIKSEWMGRLHCYIRLTDGMGTIPTALWFKAMTVFFMEPMN